MIVASIVALVVVVLALYFAAMYNNLVRSHQRVNETWSNITAQLKQRYDLIPNLVRVVKGYAKHERDVFENVTKARTGALNAQGVRATTKAENQFSQTLKSLFAVAESYPQLQASQNFRQLQADLNNTEDKIMTARRTYNQAARDFNTKRRMFPMNTMAGMIGFKQDRPYFELEIAEASRADKPTDVKF
ncbi:MAG: LemA family protein [Candidatus Saccharibacteria bacterium]